jgi:hypothetical protein
MSYNAIYKKMFENSLKEIKQKMFKLKHLEQYYVSRQIRKKNIRWRHGVKQLYISHL